MPISWLIILILIVLFILYGPFADLLFHVWRIGTVTRGSELSRELALTFDDGPDPVYTPELLELLAEHEAKAVFFLVGQKVRQYPDVVRMIHEHGHVIGNHTLNHRNFWFVPPWSVRKEIAVTNDAIAEITGEPVVYVRPPWGRFNFWQRAYMRRASLVPVLWTYACKDWRKGDRSRAIEQILLAKSRSGGIVLLHDSGGAPGAPRNTLEALRHALPRLKAMGFAMTVRPVTLAAEAEARRKGSFPRLSQRLIHPIWRRWDQLFDVLYRVYPLSRLFRLSVTRWRFGRRMVSHLAEVPSRGPTPAAQREAAAASSADRADALSAPPVILENGMPLVELHLQNLALQELLKVSPPEKMAIRGLREARDSLRQVALSMVFDERFNQAQGVWGMTMIHRGMENLGFHVEDVPPTLFNRWVTLVLTWIMILYHPQGRSRLRQGLEEMHPRLMWMTREELLSRYLPDDARQHAAEAGLL
ncbi:MAG: polysaccharide deacetylase family protein [Firmicutes bacterium]|nr:polysaccharide deacetylase family protein [Bacillota bacterium]